MATIVEYFEYAVLAAAAYVRMGGNPLDGATFAAQAASPNQSGGRLPLSLGTTLFNPADPGALRWNILDYYGEDKPGVIESTGFAATLFRRGNEKVLALRGTEPGQELGVDLWSGGIAGIGVLGISLGQVVSMVNLVERLKASANSDVVQLRVQISASPPPGQSVPVITQSDGIAYIYLTTYTARGLELIGQGERVTVTGHSLGGHLALFARWLFPGAMIDSGV
jgi:hypothetical protein